MPQALGKLAEALRHARPAIRRRWPDAGDRRRAIDAALDAGGPLDPFAAASPDAVADWLAAPDAVQHSGFRVVVLRSDDPDQLTLEQARLLGQADTIVHAADIEPEILARGRADAVRKLGEMPPDPMPRGLTVQLVREKR